MICRSYLFSIEKEPFCKFHGIPQFEKIFITNPPWRYFWQLLTHLVYIVYQSTFNMSINKLLKMQIYKIVEFFLANSQNPAKREFSSDMGAWFGCALVVYWRCKGIPMKQMTKKEKRYEACRKHQKPPSKKKYDPKGACRLHRRFRRGSVKYTVRIQNALLFPFLRKKRAFFAFLNQRLIKSIPFPIDSKEKPWYTVGAVSKDSRK